MADADIPVVDDSGRVEPDHCVVRDADQNRVQPCFILSQQSFPDHRLRDVLQHAHETSIVELHKSQGENLRRGLSRVAWRHLDALCVTDRPMRIGKSGDAFTEVRHDRLQRIEEIG